MPNQMTMMALKRLQRREATSRVAGELEMRLSGMSMHYSTTKEEKEKKKKKKNQLPNPLANFPSLETPAMHVK
ncbi:hypothetical protein ACN38_g5514 [Penicillium nordicum]|uniref:Uncharacterized protein n=1 Tax=Penicillium nordicum TaxID=229535 RepID=A0A0N0RZ06_9EURO|nr:hypothetical protein ACN38_g5514 [Penicillium nordicum]